MLKLLQHRKQGRDPRSLKEHRNRRERCIDAVVASDKGKNQTPRMAEGALPVEKRIGRHRTDEVATEDDSRSLRPIRCTIR
ncbi:hypothetical protein ZHAS_00011202 [Anopheles sinensis]|uniref:Uncharacterized protein n=1 Tax=Anopheles sinensis TaxID=74873 RepID=A0A084VZL1_ANOSI|nr:hypothetical protein ZHAS_00011202 [Anopheles sinensis]